MFQTNFTTLAQLVEAAARDIFAAEGGPEGLVTDEAQRIAAMITGSSGLLNYSPSHVIDGLYDLRGADGRRSVDRSSIQQIEQWLN